MFIVLNLFPPRSAAGTANIVHRPGDELQPSVPLEIVVERRRADHRLHDDISFTSQRSVQASNHTETHHFVLSKRKCNTIGSSIYWNPNCDGIQYLLFNVHNTYAFIYYYMYYLYVYRICVCVGI